MNREIYNTDDREMSAKLPQIFTCTMTPEEASRRLYLSKMGKFPRVSFKIIGEIDGRLKGETTVTDWGDLKKFNELGSFSLPRKSSSKQEL